MKRSLWLHPLTQDFRDYSLEVVPRGVALPRTSWAHPRRAIAVAVTPADNIVVVVAYPRSICMFTSTLEAIRTVDLIWQPNGVAVDGDCVLLVSDLSNHRIVAVREDGTEQGFLGSRGSAPGQFMGPSCVAVTHEGNVVVLDRGNERIQIVTRDGTPVHVIDTGSHHGDRWFADPVCLAVNEDGDIAVGDRYLCSVRLFQQGGTVGRQVFKESSETSVLTSVAFDRAGNIVVARTYLRGTHSGAERVVVFRPDGSVVWQMGSHGEGPGQFRGICDVALLSDGSIVVTDGLIDGRIQVL